MAAALDIAANARQRLWFPLGGFIRRENACQNHSTHRSIMIAALMPNYARAGPKTGIPASPMTPRPMKPLDAIGRSAMSMNPVSFVADLGQARSRSAYTLASASIRPCRKSLNTGARSASVWISRPKSRPDPGGPTSTALASAPSRRTTRHHATISSRE